MLVGLAENITQGKKRSRLHKAEKAAVPRRAVPLWGGARNGRPNEHGRILHPWRLCQRLPLPSLSASNKRKHSVTTGFTAERGGRPGCSKHCACNSYLITYAFITLQPLVGTSVRWLSCLNQYFLKVFVIAYATSDFTYFTSITR